MTNLDFSLPLWQQNIPYDKGGTEVATVHLANIQLSIVPFMLICDAAIKANRGEKDDDDDDGDAGYDDFNDHGDTFDDDDDDDVIMMVMMMIMMVVIR
ncbi:hypothetical protein ElyMa_002986700 [Elysia marginata]|uniref:Uncharacterized protein n=1 Tax=Elysia marginata TaxID=1093978 RepID=A0AAV4IDI0_9GAST|nr:hypothetical protein ElyMa_002986700 [Elysia marginata]